MDLTTSNQKVNKTIWYYKLRL